MNEHLREVLGKLNPKMHQRARLEAPYSGQEQRATPTEQKSIY